MLTCTSSWSGQVSNNFGFNKGKYWVLNSEFLKLKMHRFLAEVEIINKQSYSGSKYPAVPLTSREAPLSPSWGAYFEKPKSATFAHMLWSRSILLDLTSLCIMQRPANVWRCIKPGKKKKNYWGHYLEFLILKEYMYLSCMCVYIVNGN